MSNKFFLIDSSGNSTYTFNYLFECLKNAAGFDKICYTKNLFDVFCNIILSVIADKPITLVDCDLSAEELRKAGLDEQLGEKTPVTVPPGISSETLPSLLQKSVNWNVQLFTSGTTGLPKRVRHNMLTLSRNVKTGAKYQNNIWGFAFNPTHIAGLQVFFQALYNTNTLVNLFRKDSNEIVQLVREYNISNISATPTFYRQFGLSAAIMPSVHTITSGGEQFSTALTERLKGIFPKADFKNIYASTEAGTVLTAVGEFFEVPPRLLGKIKIEDGFLFLHRSLLAQLDNMPLDGEWYNTRDRVQINSENPLSMKILGRQNELINVGGYKVNPHEVEDTINQIDQVVFCKVYGKPNSVVGNIVCADIIRNDQNFDETQLRVKLSGCLQNYKIPRVVNFVNEIQFTRTGKLQRNV